MALPVLPVLKLIALGTIKIVVLGIGALVVPVLTLRLVLGGTGESIRLAALWMIEHNQLEQQEADTCLLYTSPSPRDGLLSRMPSSA